MRNYILLIFFLFKNIDLYAQNPSEVISSRTLNNFNISLLGDASMISVNYERHFFINSNILINFKIGIGYNEQLNLFYKTGKFATIPQNFTINIGKGRHFLEFGFGETLNIGKISPTYLVYPIVGYRYLPLKSNKMNFRVFGHFYTNDADGIIFVPFGISIGLSF